MRFGFVGRSMARPELKSHDTRRWQNHPHLSVSLAYLRDMFAYLAAERIRMYRMASELAPYATHPDLPQFHNQVAECRPELAELGHVARAAGLRLSFHPGQHVVLNAPDPSLAARSAADLLVQAEILDAMGLGPEAVVVTHVGGVYEDRAAARERFVAACAALPEPARRRLALENDDTRFTVADTLWIHAHTGVPLVFDTLHHRLNAPERPAADEPGLVEPRAALAACLATWPAGVRPKIHFSSPRTEFLMAEAPAADGPRPRAPRWSYHADYAHPFELIDFLRLTRDLGEYDVMLELRGKDLALLQARADLRRYAPELADEL